MVQGVAEQVAIVHQFQAKTQEAEHPQNLPFQYQAEALIQ
jgi:phage-related protein